MLFIGQMCTCYFFCFLLLQIPIFLHKIIPSPCHSPPVIFHKILGRIVRCVVLQMGSLTIGYATTKYAACRVMLQLGFTVAMCKYTYIYIHIIKLLYHIWNPSGGPGLYHLGALFFFEIVPLSWITWTFHAIAWIIHPCFFLRKRMSYINTVYIYIYRMIHILPAMLGLPRCMYLYT